ncbi:nucleoside-diphosphate kinase [Metabacillus malikii]|uniref:Nucleoside diphosphate kinase n=1 Tax=Metabacillus malikii TaxID=1504265 RepID=A0ABT9ZKY3_9BACI|nr:nucleoside-diphosphate kinase [Metabacillus malikii]MDQ0232960.1 nucleoside-diphosphate kinase [Metabacillus malikii]
MVSKTFLMVKPDGVQRQIIGDIISRFERKGLQLVGAKLMRVTTELAEEHYKEHKGKPFYENLIQFITSGPVFAMVWQGENVVDITRKLIGKTNPKDAEPGTIRGDYCLYVSKNIIHGSDSEESAVREISLFFNEDEILEYNKDIDVWIYKS